MPYVHSEIPTKNNMLSIGDIVLFAKHDYEPSDYPPDYTIKFILKSGIKTKWDYSGNKELRDKEFEMVKAEKGKIKNPLG